MGCIWAFECQPEKRPKYDSSATGWILFKLEAKNFSEISQNSDRARMI